MSNTSATGGYLRPELPWLAGAVRRVPELVNQQWYNRADFTLRFRVATVQRWAVLSVLEATLQLNKD